MPTLTPYPPSPATIDAQGRLTIDTWLRNPVRVQRRLEDLTRARFIADQFFATGPEAVGGAVLFDQVTAQDLFMARDVQQVAPGQEIPILTDEAPTPRLAAVAKWGGAVYITDEQRDRNQYDVAARQTAKLANTVLRKVDAVALATLEAAPINVEAGTSWALGSATTDAAIVQQLIKARGLINNPDNGYEADIMLANPAQRDQIASRLELLKLLTGTAGPTLAEGIDRVVGRILGLDVFVSNRVPVGTIYIAQRRVIGGISNETPLRTEVIPERRSEKTWIQSTRRLVPYVTDPKAATKLVGIA